VCSKADSNQLTLPHWTKNSKLIKERKTKNKKIGYETGKTKLTCSLHVSKCL